MTTRKRTKPILAWMRRCGAVRRYYDSEYEARLDLCQSCRISEVEIRELPKRKRAKKGAAS